MVIKKFLQRPSVVALAVVYCLLAVVLVRHFTAHPDAKAGIVSPAITKNLQTVSTLLNSEYPAMSQARFPLAGVDWMAESIDQANTSPALSMPGEARFKSNQLPGLGWSWTGHDPSADELYKNIAITLVNDGFSQDNDTQAKQQSGQMQTYFTLHNFHQRDQHCALISWSDAGSFSSDSVNNDEFRCYDNATLQGRQTTTKQQQQIEAILKAAYSKMAVPKQIASVMQTRIASQNKGGVISASETAGYDIAEASFTFAGSADAKLALFYEYNGQWHYVTTASDEYGFSCGDMRADAGARAALHDQICYDYNPPAGGQQGTQRLDTDRHF
ncbi:MAG TPA: hypothetical protein VLG16_00790 [Candidatus Saccharimonadales bacterium]|nr:hypothetical protein [Candidatus Saccharimonadales bacterium]